MIGIENSGWKHLELRTRAGEKEYRRQLRLRMRPAGQLVRRAWQRNIRAAFAGGEGHGSFARSIRVKLKWNTTQASYDMRIGAYGKYPRGTKRHGPRSRWSLPRAYSGIFEVGGTVYRRGKTLARSSSKERVAAWALSNALGVRKRWSAIRGKPHTATYRARPTLGPAMARTMPEVMRVLGQSLEYVVGRR